MPRVVRGLNAIEIKRLMIARDHCLTSCPWFGSNAEISQRETRLTAWDSLAIAARRYDRPIGLLNKADVLRILRYQTERSPVLQAEKSTG